MEYVSVSEIAARWKISEHRVQVLCKEGRIQGVKKFGKSYMIPVDSEKPSDARIMRKKEGISTFRKSPFLDMTDFYQTPGTADACIQALSPYPEAQALFSAEIAYSRGEVDKVLKGARSFLQSHGGFYPVNGGGMLLALAAMWKGDIALYRTAKIHITQAPAKNDDERSIITLSLACIDSAVRDISSYPEWFKIGRIGHLPVDAQPAARVFYIKYLLVFAQEMAKSRFTLPDVTGLGLLKSIPYIVEPMIAQAVAEKTVIPEIYLRLLCAIAYYQVGDRENATFHIDRAIELALPDRLFGILAEHRRQFDYLLDERLAAYSQEACEHYKALHKQLLDGWTKLHNSLLSKSVSNALTIREREIARLASFGLSNQEIAERVFLSVDAVKKCIFRIMNKTGTEKREEFGAFV